LIGAAVAYAVSGESSMSADQWLHEGVRTATTWGAADETNAPPSTS